METALDIIAAMRRQEDVFYQAGDFLVFGNHPVLRDVDANCRTRMAEWCFQVVDFCKFQRESVEIAMNFLDRYLLVDTSALNSRVVFQLASMTCLYMAVKIHEPEAMDPSSVSMLSRGTYSVDEIEDMELKILNSLHWRVNPPTSVSFARQLLAIIPDEVLTAKQSETVSHIIAMQLDLAVSDNDLITVKSSIKAFCAIANAVELLALDSKATAHVRHAMAKAIDIDENDEGLEELSDYLFAAVAQREPGMIHVPHNGKQVKSYTQQRTSVAGFSPCSTVVVPIR